MAERSAPLWQQVRDDLERRIATGDFADRFPTDRELVEHYHVSRHTAREAVRRMRSRGAVERHRGRGSFVNSARLTQPLGGLYSLFRSVEDQGLEQRSEVRALECVRDVLAASQLGLAPDAELVHLARTRFAADEPLAVDDVWMPYEVGAPLLGVDFTRTALYEELLRRTGRRLTAVEEELEPRIADDATTRELRLAEGEALLAVRRRGFSGSETIEYRTMLIRGQRLTYTYRWQAEDADA